MQFNLLIGEFLASSGASWSNERETEEERFTLEFWLRQKRKGNYKEWTPALTPALTQVQTPRPRRHVVKFCWEVTRRFAGGKYDLGSCAGAGWGS